MGEWVTKRIELFDGQAVGKWVVVHGRVNAYPLRFSSDGRYCFEGENFEIGRGIRLVPDVFEHKGFVTLDRGRAVVLQRGRSLYLVFRDSYKDSHISVDQQIGEG